jgi:hypothetical protein
VTWREWFYVLIPVAWVVDAMIVSIYYYRARTRKELDREP